MGCLLGNSWCCWQKPKLGSIAGAYQPSRWAANLFQSIRQSSGKDWIDCVWDCLLVITEKWSPRVLATWMGPEHVEPWKWPNPVRKDWRSGYKAKNLGRKVTVQITLPATNFHCWVYINQPFFLWFANTISIHVWDVLSDCTFALHVRDVPWDQ